MLKIYLFGRIRLEHEQIPISFRITPSVQAILAYLLLQPKRSYSRDVLMELGWGDRPQDQARSCLNTALWRLRNILEPEGVARGTYLCTGHADDISFNWDSNYWIDLSTFQNEVTSFLDTPLPELDDRKTARLESSIALYTGDLLEGLYYSWALREQERSRALYLKSLSRLMQYYQGAGLYDKTINIAQQILHHDPLREDVHRELIAVYLKSGQRALAAQQYETCRAALQNELGVQPMPETSALYDQAFAGLSYSGRAPSPVTDCPSGEDLRQTIDYLKIVLSDLDGMRHKVKHALLTLEQYHLNK
jgi:DNA-binding SARP family transcriptional activator